MDLKGPDGEKYDLIWIDYEFSLYESNLDKKMLLYDKSEKFFINTNFRDGKLGETIDSSDYEVFYLKDVDYLEEANSDNIKRLNSSWKLPSHKPVLDNNTENLGVAFGIFGIIGDVAIRGIAQWYIIKFKNGKKAIFGSMSKRVEKIMKEM